MKVCIGPFWLLQKTPCIVTDQKSDQRHILMYCGFCNMLRGNVPSATLAADISHWIQSSGVLNILYRFKCALFYQLLYMRISLSCVHPVCFQMSWRKWAELLVLTADYHQVLIRQREDTVLCWLSTRSSFCLVCDILLNFKSEK